MSKVKVTRPLNIVTENQPYLLNGKSRTSPLGGAGAYCGDRTTGRTVAQLVNAALLGVYTVRSVRLVCPTSRMKRLHVPIVGPTGRPDPAQATSDWSVRPVGRTDRSDRV